MIFNFFKKKANGSQQPKPDFSEIDSLKKAMELYSGKILSMIYLMPLEFGGTEAQINTLFVPEFVVVLKARFDATILDLLTQGKNLSYKAYPEYKGTSFIPSRILIKVSGDANFEEIIAIW